MRVRLLGPIDVVVDEASRPVRGLRRTAVLAVLALHRGEIVGTDRLVDVVWPGGPPVTAVNTLQSHISHLRRVLGSRTAIVPHPAGYLLDPDRVGSDVDAAERLIRLGTRNGGREGVRQLRDALALWRGRPLADVAGLPWLAEQATRLEQLRLRGVRALAEARLALGEHAEVLPELETLVAEQQFDEQLHAHLMLALYRAGRQADALAAYRRLRRTLRDELGIDPGQPVRDLEAAILRQDPDLGVRYSVATAPVAAAPDAGPEAPLLERESSLAALVDYAAQASAGDGRLVLVAGEAGVGKTALVERLRRELPEARWSWGACDGLFTPQPLGPLFDLADQLDGRLLERCRAGADRDELFRALLRQVSPSSILDVVVVEDIHWADEATLDLLRFLGRRLRNAAVLLIVTYRHDSLGASAAVRVALGDLAAQRATRRLDLAPLSADAVRVLADRSGLEMAELHELTGGNPFYVTEVLRAGTGAVPASARDAVLARAARLTVESREVLDIAALIGTRVELRLLSSIGGCAPSAVDELLTSGLLAGDGGSLRFRHEIARRAVAEAVAAHRSRAIHARTLEALRAFGCEDDARMAYHAEGAGDGPAVLRHATAAARRSARLASHREAAAQFQRALRFAAETDTAPVAGLYDGLADELSLIDRMQEAAEAGERALALWRAAGNPLREGDTLRRLSRIRWNLCQGRDATIAAEEAVSILEPLGPTTELAYAYATFASQRMLRSEFAAAAELALRAQATAEPLGALGVISDALNTLAVSAAYQGADWTGQMRRALEIALAGSFPEPAARAFANFGDLHSERRQFADAERYFAAGAAYCDEHDLTSHAICLQGQQATIMEHRGRWDEAVAMSMEVLANLGSSRVNRLCGLRRLGLIRARRGEAGAWEYLDEAAAAADRSGEPQQILAVRVARAEAYWLQGEVGEAGREAELADDVTADRGDWQRGAVAIWLLRTGSARPAGGTVAEPYRLQLGGDWMRAAQVWTALDCPYDAAMALCAAPDEEALRRALTIFTGLGATPAARIVRRRLQLLGAGRVTV